MMMGLLNFCLLLTVFALPLVNAEMLGKFIFHSNEGSDKNNFLSILHQPSSIQFAPSPGPIPSNELASVLALSLGFSTPKDINWAGLQVSNPFNLPKAVMMLSIDNLPKGHKLNLASTVGFPVAEVDGVSSISDMYYVSSTYSLSSHLSAISEGKSKIVSTSGDERIAASGYSNSPVSEASTWSDLTNSWKVVTGQGDIKDSLTRKQVLKRIPDILISGFTYNEKEQTVGVNIKGVEVSFNLDDKTDFKLFSELVYMMWQYEELEAKKSSVRDYAPDLYLMSISALKDIEKKYGADSKKVQAALVLIEKFVDGITKKFVKLYDGNILVVGLTVQSEIGHINEHHEDLKPVLKVLEDNNVMLLNFDNSSPEIHVMNELEATAQEKLCEAIQGSVAQLGKPMQFKCVHDLPRHSAARRSLLNTAEAPDDAELAALNLSSHYDDMFPVIFNIWFWLIVILALTVYAVSLAMWNMDPGRDSIIYRLTQQKIKSE